MANQKQELNGWKEIARYLGRGLRTVQRWERQLALPVRRPRDASRSAVIAWPTELDAWLAATPFNNNQTISQPMPRLSAALPAPIKVLVVEDSVGDLNTCVGVLRRMGVAQVDAVSNVSAALHLLSQMADGSAPKPDWMVVDLGFSIDSGFDVLHYWRTNRSLHSIRVIVWTELDNKQQAFCNAFGVERIVPKWAGVRELEQALRAPDTRVI